MASVVDMRIMHTAAALIITSVVAGVIINNVMHGDVHMHGVEVVHVVAAPAEVAPVEAPPSLGENDPIVPLVCGVNLDCSDVDRMAAAHAKPKSSRTVRTTHSSTGATSTTVTQKTPAGSTTTRVSRSAKGVTTTSTSTTVSR
jgi:hypothetical protein